MKAGIRYQLLFQRCVVLCTAAMILFSTQRAVAGVNESIAKTTIKTLAFLEPELPPLGAASLYLPLEESPANKTNSNLVNKLRGTRLVIKLSDRRVYLYQGKKLQVSYPVAIGKPGWETPKGSYKVMEMQTNPTWQHPLTGKIVPPGADNPLGSRWIGFWTDGRNLIGFHGTPQENLVGQAVSHGCIRMRNQDILALYKQVDIGTPVTVEP